MIWLPNIVNPDEFTRVFSTPFEIVPIEPAIGENIPESSPPSILNNKLGSLTEPNFRNFIELNIDIYTLKLIINLNVYKLQAMAKEITLPKKELSQLFPAGNFRLTNVSLFSIAPPDHAKITVDILKKYYTSKQLKTKTYVDGTSNVGGNIFPVAKLVKKMICVEIDKLTSEILEHNLRTFYTQKNFKKIQVLNEDFTKFNFKKHNPDILFIDPPWGGKKYKQLKDKEMYLSGVPMSKLLMDQWAVIADLIILRVPMAYPTHRLISVNKIRNFRQIDLKTNYGRNIYKLLIFSKDPPIGNISKKIVVRAVPYKSFHPAVV